MSRASLSRWSRQQAAKWYLKKNRPNPEDSKDNKIEPYGQKTKQIFKKSTRIADGKEIAERWYGRTKNG